MKIISGKKWEEINQEIVNLKLDLNEAKIDNSKYLEQVEYLQNSIKTETSISDDLVETIEEYEIRMKKQKDTIRKLKTLLTKNKIDYKEILEKKKEK